jgi:hypothetical protein
MLPFKTKLHQTAAAYAMKHKLLLAPTVQAQARAQKFRNQVMRPPTNNREAANREDDTAEDAYELMARSHSARSPGSW